MIIQRRAFTLIELLVVIAIIAVLIALFSPPCRRPARQARRAQCVNNLKQFGLALNNYESACGVFPFGQGADYMISLPSAPVYARWSANSQLLAYMEQATLWNAINFSLPPETPDPGALGMMMGMGMLMPYQDPNRANSTVFGVSMVSSSARPTQRRRRAPATVMWATTTIRTRGAG